MDLYSVISNYQLLNAIVYRLLHKDSCAKLILCEWNISKIVNIDIIDYFFEEVVVIDANYRFTHSLEETEQYIFREIGDIKQYDKIIVWGAQYTLGVYLAEIECSFIYGEDGSGLVSRPEVLESNDSLSILKKDYYCNYVKEMGLYDGSNDSIDAIICNLQAQRNDFYLNKDIIDFSVVDEMAELTQGEINQIMSIFTDENNIDISKDAVLLLTEHFANLRVMSFEDQVVLYQMFMDYILENMNVVIKPHPDDILYYSRLFPDVPIIRSSFPAEFMPYIFSNKPRALATVDSTVVHNMRNSIDEIIEMGTWFRTGFRLLHKYYFAAQLAKEMNKTIMLLGCNEDVCNHFINNSIICDDENIEKIDCDDSVLIIDCLDSFAKYKQAIELWKNNNCMLIFLNSDDGYAWYDYYENDYWEEGLGFAIKKKMVLRECEDVYASTDDEMIWVYPSDCSERKIINDFYLCKKLKYTGIVLEGMTYDEDENNLFLLESRIIAAQNRLLLFVNRESSYDDVEHVECPIKDDIHYELAHIKDLYSGYEIENVLKGILEVTEKRLLYYVYKDND